MAMGTMKQVYGSIGCRSAQVDSAPSLRVLARGTIPATTARTVPPTQGRYRAAHSLIGPTRGCMNDSEAPLRRSAF